MRHCRRFLAVVLAVSAIAAAPSCSDEGDRTSTPAPASPAAESPATSRFADDSPFCRELVDLDARGRGQSLRRSEVISVYEQVRDDVPAEIRSEFELVLERLRLEEAGASIESPEVAAAAALRLAEYVDLHCRGTADNPGPPPTEPR